MRRRMLNAIGRQLLLLACTGVACAAMLCAAHRCAAQPAATPQVGRFRVDSTRIIGPDGRRFVPIGANLNGPHSFWPGRTLDAVDALVKHWRFNCVRLNALLPGYGHARSVGGPGDKYKVLWNVNNDLDAIIQAFTARGVVVQIELHNWTGSMPVGEELEAAARYYTDLARRYRDNTYVWFNPFNEPGTVGEARKVAPHWVAGHQRIIRAIRDGGADNLIVLDGIAAGNDRGSSWGDRTTARDEHSAILTFGEEVCVIDGKAVPNILFSFHSYTWGMASEVMAGFIDRIHAKGLCVMIGEAGWYVDQKNVDAFASRAVRNCFAVALDKGVGILAWHGQPGDGMALTRQGTLHKLGDDPDKPTTLTWIGELFWKATRERGFGLPPSAAP